MNIKSQWFYFLFFLTVIFFILTLPVISPAQWKDELVFQVTDKRGIAETLEREVEQDDKGEKSSDISFIELSIANHINQFKSCGFNRDDIKVKKYNRQSNSIITYIIYGSSRNLQCLISKKSKTTKELYDNNLIFFQSLHDDNSIFEYPHSNPENRKIYPLEEGLIKFDDRFIVFTAPGSEGGVIDITKFSSDSVLVKVAYPSHNGSYLVSLPALKLGQVNLNSVKANERINKSSKKNPTDLIVQEDEFNVFKQKISREIADLRATITSLIAQENEFNVFKKKSSREIADFRATITSLRNQIACLKSGQTRVKQRKTSPSYTEKSSGLTSPVSSKQNNKTGGNLDKVTNKKGIVQSGHPINSEINAKDYILVVTKNRPLNVRQKASTLSPVIASLINGSKVPFTGTTANDAVNFNGLWYQVEYAKRKFGWVSSDYSRKVKESKNKTSHLPVEKLESNKLTLVEGMKLVEKTNKKNFKNFIRSADIIKKQVVEVEADSPLAATKGFFKRPFPSSTDINPADVVVSYLYSWVKAWESQDTPLYLSFYSENFEDPKRSRSQWEAYRRKTLEEAVNISVQVWDIKIYSSKKSIIRVTFIQRFKSNKFSDVGLKELVWENGPKGWKIIKESWKPWPVITGIEN